MSEQMRRHESDHEVPWSLPIVVRRSKSKIARHIDVLEAAATAVVMFLDDPRSQLGGEWHEAVDYWRNGAIRKVVRRGDGKKLEDARELGCVSVSLGGDEEFGAAEALVFPPGPVQPLPPELKKLQVSGTEFPDGGESSVPAAEAVVLIELSPGLTLTTGKAAAQCGHAAQLAYEQMPAEALRQWRDSGFRLRVTTASERSWADNAQQISVIDAGFTEVDGPTETVRASW
ncbi:peptidyl-tRNA hydrolase [Brevibacterium renqingii]|uniref:peptidyl-tRNA hydrolase n=1 Tax=Brevibacterium renqingii TaxID=2776916 RepID=UPI001ADFFD5B|nr:peptidyl-tRNA hydrolase [Brevibacterium renqingii]